MIKIQKTIFRQTINGVKLYRDDIEEILDRCNFTIRFSVPDSSVYQNLYDSIDEIIEYKGNGISSLNIIGSPQNSLESFSIEIKKEKATIYCNGSKEICLLGYELESLLRKKTLWYYFILQPFFGIGIFFGVLVSSLILKEKTLLKWDSACIFLIWLIAFGNHYLNFKIKLFRKHEKFFNRNKEKIILELLKIILSAIIGGIISYYFFKKC